MWVFALVVADIILIALSESSDRQIAALVKSRLAALLAFVAPFFIVAQVRDLRVPLFLFLLGGVMLGLTVIFTAFGIYDFSVLGGRTSSVEYIIYFGVPYPRTSGSLHNFGDLAIIFSVSLLLLWAVIRERAIHWGVSPGFIPTMVTRTASPLFWCVALPVIVSATILCGSRNVMLSLLATFGAFFFLNSSGKAVRSNGVGFALLVGFLAFGLVVSISVAWVDIYNLIINARYESSLARIGQYAHGIDMVVKSPLIGNGIEVCYYDGLPIHNFLLYIGCRSGIVVALGFVLTFSYVAFHCVAKIRSHAGVRGFGLYSFAGSGLVGIACASSFFSAGAGNGSPIFWGVSGLLASIVFIEDRGVAVQ